MIVIDSPREREAGSDRAGGSPETESDDVADLEYEIVDGVGTITLNRPEKGNSFTLEMIDRWAGIYRDARTNPDVRAIVLTGAGRFFCSGADLGVLDADEQTPLSRKRVLTDHVHRVGLALEDLDKPVIAAVNGAAVGAGMDMALMCDIRFAGSSARLSEGYVRLGIVPGDGGCYYLPRLVGVAKALELLLTGDFVDAEEAHRIGIVNDVYPDDELLPRAQAFAKRLADGPTIALGMIKRAAYQSARSDLRTAFDLVSSHMAVAQLTDDAQEAYRALKEKRPPAFRGR